MGPSQNLVGQVCDLYFQSMRRHVYVTPKSYLCLIDFYKQLYKVKYDEVNILEKSVNTGIFQESIDRLYKKMMAIRSEETQ